jgi:hypothetical protein
VAGPHALAERVPWKRRREHREGSGNTLDEVVAVRAHPSSGSTCGGGADAARRCPTVIEAVQSCVVLVAGSAVLEEKGEGETRATCESRRMEDRLTEEAETRCRGGSDFWWRGSEVTRGWHGQAWWGAGR